MIPAGSVPERKGLKLTDWLNSVGGGRVRECSFTGIKHEFCDIVFLAGIRATLIMFARQNVINEWIEAQTEKAMTPHSSTLAWKIPWTEEPGGLPSMGL